METLIDFFDFKNLMPHSYYFSWNPLLLWLQVASDLLIALSCYRISLNLAYFIYATDGKKVKQGIFTKQQNQVNIKNLPDGAYSFEIQMAFQICTILYWNHIQPSKYQPRFSI